MSGEWRRDIRPGLTVDIVLKADQRTGKKTRGVVAAILTNSPHHPHGIKVRLTDGQVGRVCAIIARSGDDQGDAVDQTGKKDR
ncbi:YwbE family protein [Methanofollis tationis]|uniref:YwbE family protein n=1 Tax=Methanofollis tationis TaxID=81417 RepID=A0A7K4HMW3_9EURY|nr:YwbE family protein [Methanofollis tationis]